MTTTCATDECEGYPSDINTATVTNREYHTNGGYSVVSLDANGEVTTAVIGKSKIPASNYLPPTPLDTGEDGQFSSCHGSDISSKRVQDLSTPRKITSKSEAAARATESPLTSNHLHNQDNVYDIIFEGLFDQKGGVLSHEDSDVQLHIPRGAIPSGEKQPIIVKVSLRVSYFNVGLKDEQIPLTPVVECLSPGLENFLDYITVKLPHRALLPGKDAKSWRFLVHYNQSMNPRDKSWLKVDQSELSVENNVVVPVKFTVDEKYVNVRTKHFTKFTCSSCGKQRPIFAMDAVAYGKYIQESEQVAVKVYLCDTIKETKVRVAAEERCYSNKSAIGIKPKVADGDWQISCLDNHQRKTGNGRSTRLEVFCLERRLKP
ncbi:netrin receptor UNC5C-like [Ptychodera flava]|uniref:netrin receptor UNC5C-like n=1 Tax=Ptychodera flava TaxID=63121 RepID=UPI003969C0C4